MARNFGRNLFWQITEIMSFGGIYFGSCASLCHNDIHSKMTNPGRGGARLQMMMGNVTEEYRSCCLTKCGVF